MAGADRATLPGTMEWRRQSEWQASGIPITDDHRDLLENIAWGKPSFEKEIQLSARLNNGTEDLGGRRGFRLDLFSALARDFEFPFYNKHPLQGAIHDDPYVIRADR